MLSSASVPEAGRARLVNRQRETNSLVMIQTLLPVCWFMCDVTRREGEERMGGEGRVRKRRGVSGTSQLNVSSIVNTPNAMSFYSKVLDFFKLKDRPGSGLQPQRPGLSPEQTIGTPTPGETLQSPGLGNLLSHVTLQHHQIRGL